jgi:hypothetical protein
MSKPISQPIPTNVAPAKREQRTSAMWSRDIHPEFQSYYDRKTKAEFIGMGSGLFAPAVLGATIGVVRAARSMGGIATSLTGHHALFGGLGGFGLGVLGGIMVGGYLGKEIVERHMPPKLPEAKFLTAESELTPINRNELPANAHEFAEEIDLEGSIKVTGFAERSKPRQRLREGFSSTSFVEHYNSVEEAIAAGTRRYVGGNNRDEAFVVGELRNGKYVLTDLMWSGYRLTEILSEPSEMRVEVSGNSVRAIIDTSGVYRRNLS